MGYLKRFRVSFIVLSILYVLLGLMLIIWPQISLAAICKFIGTVILILGVVRVINFFTNEEFRGSSRLDLANGLLNILLGLFMLISPESLVKALPIILGIVIIVDSMIRLQLSIELKMGRYENWWIGFVLAILTAIFGTVLVFNPFAGSIILGRFLGIGLAADGIVNLWILISLRRRLKDFDVIEQKYWDV